MPCSNSSRLCEGHELSRNRGILRTVLLLWSRGEGFIWLAHNGNIILMFLKSCFGIFYTFEWHVFAQQVCERPSKLQQPASNITFLKMALLLPYSLLAYSCGLSTKVANIWHPKLLICQAFQFCPEIFLI